MTEEPEVQKEETPKPKELTQEEIDRAINKLFGVSGAICMN